MSRLDTQKSLQKNIKYIVAWEVAPKMKRDFFTMFLACTAGQADETPIMLARNRNKVVRQFTVQQCFFLLRAFLGCRWPPLLSLFVQCRYTMLMVLVVP